MDTHVVRREVVRRWTARVGSLALLLAASCSPVASVGASATPDGAAASAACASSTGQATTTGAVHGWSQLVPGASPVARSEAAMEYDAARGEVVLFGGICGESTMLADTWLWNGKSWREAKPAQAPSARSRAGVAYDSVRRQVVLFGGIGGDGLPLPDTWTWDGTGWTEAHPVTRPSARSGPNMTYDPITRRVLLFGGYASGTANPAEPGGCNECSDSWTWDGTSWEELHPLGSPPPRYGGAIGADPKTGRVILFGGRRPDLAGDTFAWDGATWSDVSSSAAPSKRVFTHLVPTGSDALLLFGGEGDKGALGDTWLWRDGWTAEAGTSTPPPRIGAALAQYGTGGVLLFGGFQLTATGRVRLGDTWAWRP